MWHKKFSSCQNCNSEDYPYKSRGYCIRCYPIILRLEKSEKWEYNNPSTLKTFPGGFIDSNEKTFNKIKKNIIRQLNERLDWFKIREKRLKEDIFGIDIEYGLNKIANLCGVRNKDLFHGSANTFDHNFTMEQKKIIFEFIDMIEQNINWRGIDWARVIIDR